MAEKHILIGFPAGEQAVLRQLEMLMAPSKTLFLVPILWVAIAIPANAQHSFSEWLGPQTNDNATIFAPVVGKPIDPAKHDKLSRYQIDLEIVKGKDLELTASQNATVTFEGKGLRQTKEFRVDKDANYLVGKMQLKKDQLGWRFYTLNVRVREGPLKGAVIHLRDGKIQDSITDPCLSIYRIPDGLTVETGKVPFDVVALFAK